MRLIDKLIGALYPDDGKDEWALESRDYVYDVVWKKKNSIIVVPYKEDTREHRETGETRVFRKRKSLLPKRIGRSNVGYRGRVHISRREYFPASEGDVSEYANDEPRGGHGIVIDSDDTNIEGNNV